MSRNTLIGRLLTPGGFALALGLFLLPFLTMSCSGPSEGIEDMPFSSDVAMSVSYTAVDLILDGTPTIELQQGGQKVTIDASGLPDEAGAEQEPVPTKIRTPMIGAAAAILVGLLLAALIGAAAVRKTLVAILALGAAGALAYVVYVAAPGYVDDAMAEASAQDLPPGVTFETMPALGFWAIVGVLAVVLVLQFIPTPATAPAAPGAPPMPYGAPVGSPPPGAGGPPPAAAPYPGQ